jgi:hypothetical protein
MLGGWRASIAAASLITAASLVAGLGWLSWSVMRGDRRNRSLLQRLIAVPEGLLLVWMASIWIAALGMRLQYVHPHYFAITYPVSLVIAVLTLHRVARGIASGATPFAARLTSALILAVSVSYGTWTLCFFRFVSEHGGTAGDYGVVYRDKRAVVDFARSQGRAVRSNSMPELPMLEDAFHDGASPADGPVLRVERPTPDESTRCDGDTRTFGALEACLER